MLTIQLSRTRKEIHLQLYFIAFALCGFSSDAISSNGAQRDRIDFNTHTQSSVVSHRTNRMSKVRKCWPKQKRTILKWIECARIPLALDRVNCYEPKESNVMLCSYANGTFFLAAVACLALPTEWWMFIANIACWRHCMRVATCVYQYHSEYCMLGSIVQAARSFWMRIILCTKKVMPDKS